MRGILGIFVLIAVLFGAACQRAADTSKAASQPSASAVASQAASSAEGMCLEHGVLEAV